MDVVQSSTVSASLQIFQFRGLEIRIFGSFCGPSGEHTTDEFLSATICGIFNLSRWVIRPFIYTHIYLYVL